MKLFFIKCICLVFITSCELNERTVIHNQKSRLESANGAMIETEYKKIGVKLHMPQNSINVRKFESKSYVERAGFKLLAFDLGVVSHPLILLRDNDVIWTVSVKVYDETMFEKASSQFSSNPWIFEPSNSWNIGKVNKAKKSYGEIQTFDLGRRRLGYEQIAYFLCDKSINGSYFTATIVYSKYSSNISVFEKDRDQIINILESIELL